MAAFESMLQAPVQDAPAMIRRALPASLFAPSLIAACALWVQAPATAQSRLLEQVPADAHTVAHLQDATVILEQVKRNDVYRLLGDEAGEPLYDQLRGMSADGFDDMINLGQVLAGEAVLFSAKQGTGLMVEPRGDRVALMAALRSFTDTPPAGEGMAVQQLGEHQIESSVPLDLDPASGARGREAIEVSGASPTPVKVMISGPRILAALQGDKASVQAWAAALCSDMPQPALAPLARKLRSARALHGPAGQLEVFADLSFFQAEAAEALKAAGEGMLIDPSRLIGLDENAYLYGSFALPAGMNIDLRLHLQITPGTLLAKLADTMRPLPSDLLGRIPAEVTGLHVMNWDFNRCYAQLLEALREDSQERGADQIDQVVAAGSALAGSELEEEFFGQFTGVFGLFFMPPLEALSLADMQESLLGVFLHMGIFARVRDADAIMEVVDAMLGAVRANLAGSADERGFEVMSLEEAAPYDGGLAFGANHFLATVTRRVMDASLTTFGGETERSLLAGSKLRSIFDGQQGAAAISAFRLGMLRELLREEERGVELPEGMEGLYDTYVVSTVRRVRTGFDLRVQLQ